MPSNSMSKGQIQVNNSSSKNLIGFPSNHESSQSDLSQKVIKIISFNMFLGVEQDSPRPRQYFEESETRTEQSQR